MVHPVQLVLRNTGHRRAPPGRQGGAVPTGVPLKGGLPCPATAHRGHTLALVQPVVALSGRDRSCCTAHSYGFLPGGAGLGPCRPGALMTLETQTCTGALRAAGAQVPDFSGCPLVVSSSPAVLSKLVEPSCHATSGGCQWDPGPSSSLLPSSHAVTAASATCTL